jgi:hypothetical protein
MHGQDQDQKGLVEMAVIELRGLSEDIGDELVGELELAENGGFCLHRSGGGGSL